MPGWSERSEEMHCDTRIRPVTYGLAVYLLLGAFDALSISTIGSVLKIAAFIPLGLMLLELRRLRLHLHSLLGLQLGFWILAMASVLYSVSADITFSSDISLTLNLMLVLMLGILVPYNTRELELLQKAMLWGCWLQIVFTLAFADFSAAGRLTLRFGNSTQDQNNNNTFFLYAFSYHCYQILCQKKRKHIIPVLMIFAMVLLSGSRGALVAYVLTFLFFICLYFKNSKRPLRSICIVAVLLIAPKIIILHFLLQLP